VLRTAARIAGKEKEQTAMVMKFNNRISTVENDRAEQVILSKFPESSKD